MERCLEHTLMPPPPWVKACEIDTIITVYTDVFLWPIQVKSAVKS